MRAGLFRESKELLPRLMNTCGCSLTQEGKRSVALEGRATKKEACMFHITKEEDMYMLGVGESAAYTFDHGHGTRGILPSERNLDRSPDIDRHSPGSTLDSHGFTDFLKKSY